MAIDATAVSFADLIVSPAALARSDGESLLLSFVGPRWSQVAALPLPAMSGWCAVWIDADVLAGSVYLQLTDAAGTVFRAVGIDSRATGRHLLRVHGLQRGSELRFVTSDRSDGPAVLSLRGIEIEPWVGSAPTPTTTLTAVYDLNIRPAAYTVAFFLLAAEQQRRDRGLDTIGMVIVPEGLVGTDLLPEGFRVAYPASSRAAFTETIIPEMALLLPGVGSVCRATDPVAVLDAISASENVFGDEVAYGVEIPVHKDVSAVLSDAHFSGGAGRLVPTDDSLALVDEWLERVRGDRRVVTVTPRIDRYDVAANSRIDTWVAALQNAEDLVILVPDPRDPVGTSPPGPWVEFPLAGPANNLALYQRADVNLAEYGGQSMPLFTSPFPFSMWLPVGNGAESLSVRHLRDLGFVPGQPVPMLTPAQRLVYSAPSVTDLRAAMVGLEPASN